MNASLKRSFVVLFCHSGAFCYAALTFRGVRYPSECIQERFYKEGTKVIKEALLCPESSLKA